MPAGPPPAIQQRICNLSGGGKLASLVAASLRTQPRVVHVPGKISECQRRARLGADDGFSQRGDNRQGQPIFNKFCLNDRRSDFMLVA